MVQNHQLTNQINTSAVTFANVTLSGVIKISKIRIVQNEYIKIHNQEIKLH